MRPSHAETVHDEAIWAYPIYLVSAASDSSSPAGWDEAIAQAFSAFLDDVAADPEVAESIYVSHLLHACGVWTLRPMQPAYLSRASPRPASRFLPSYTGLFHLLRETLEHDAAELAASGTSAYLPVVVLVIGPEISPADSWRDAHDLLVNDADAIGDGSRAIVVPVTLGTVHAAEDLTDMAHPTGTAKAYRCESMAGLAAVLRVLLRHVAKRLTGGGHAVEQLLPDDHALGDVGIVVSPADLADDGPKVRPTPGHALTVGDSPP